MSPIYRTLFSEKVQSIGLCAGERMKKILFWDHVKFLNRKKGVTQTSLAKACGVPISTFKYWIQKNFYPSVMDAFIIAKKLGVTMEFLVTGKEKPSKKVVENIRLHLQKAEKKLEKIP